MGVGSDQEALIRQAPGAGRGRPAFTSAVYSWTSGFSLLQLAAVSSSSALQNNRWYGSEEEYRQRLQVFLENKQRIEGHNAGNHTFQSKHSAQNKDFHKVAWLSDSTS